MQWPHPVEAESHIVAEFNRNGVEYRNSGSNNFKFNCHIPHEAGPDTGLHMEITRDGRKVHCWVCDWHGSWNKLAKETGMAAFSSVGHENTYTERVAKTDIFGKLADDLNGLFLEETESLPPDLIPWSQPSWRGLSNKFLSRVPSFLWKQQLKSKSGRHFHTERILWPYYQCDRLVGYVGRRLDKLDFQKYFRAPWCHAKNVLFPYDYVRTHFPATESVVLVEGEVDALNLLQSGIPALSILGSNNWSEHKRDLLLSLGVKRVFLLMDPDMAGRLATQKIRPELVNFFDYVQAIKIDGTEDPGDLDRGQLAWLKNHVSLDLT